MGDLFDPAQIRRLKRVAKIMAQNPGRFCWATLVHSALDTGGNRVPGWLQDAQDAIVRCREDAEKDGECYCGVAKKEVSADG